MRARPRPSLKARAIALLAQREHSRPELRRKLLAHAAAEAKETVAATDGEPADPSAQIDALLDWLEAQDYLSAERFIASRVEVRSARFGSERIRRELAQHGISLDVETLSTLKRGELDRARAVWSRRFGAPAADAAGRAKQARFLAGRGFSGEVIRRVVSGLDED